jgi:hypothetical protein
MNIVRGIDYPEVEAASVVLGYSAASWVLPTLEEEVTIWRRKVGK